MQTDYKGEVPDGAEELPDGSAVVPADPWELYVEVPSSLFSLFVANRFAYFLLLLFINRTL